MGTINKITCAIWIIWFFYIFKLKDPKKNTAYTIPQKKKKKLK